MKVYSVLIIDTYYYYYNYYFYYNSCRSSLEIFSVGGPIVVQSNKTSILQLTSAMYRVMGMDGPQCCVADTDGNNVLCIFPD